MKQHAAIAVDTSRRPIGRRGLRWLLAALCAVLGTSAGAADLQVAPILLEFPAGQQAQGVWLTNTGTHPLHAQLRVQRWTQSAGDEQLSPTRDLVPSPPIVQIAAGERQLVRIVRPQVTPTQREQAYRLLVDELPDDARRTDERGLQFLLRYSIPVFVLPDGVVAAADRVGAAPMTDLSRVSASLHRGDNDGNGTLEVVNDGPQRIRISQVVAVAADGSRMPLAPGLLGYVLAGERMTWTLPVTPTPGTRLQATINNDVKEQDLPLAAAGR